jgi:hypothetical protein
VIDDSDSFQYNVNVTESILIILATNATL